MRGPLPTPLLKRIGDVGPRCCRNFTPGGSPVVIISPVMLNALDWSGCILGLLGAFLLATNTRISEYGWLAFLAANMATIGLAIGIGRNGLLLQQIGFIATSCLGIYRSNWKSADPIAANARQLPRRSSIKQLGSLEDDRKETLDMIADQADADRLHHTADSDSTPLESMWRSAKAWSRALVSRLTGRTSKVEYLEGDTEHAWSISCRLAAVPDSYIALVPEDLADLITEAKGLHVEMARGATEREQRGEPSALLQILHAGLADGRCRR